MTDERERNALEVDHDDNLTGRILVRGRLLRYYQIRIFVKDKGNPQCWRAWCHKGQEGEADPVGRLATSTGLEIDHMEAPDDERYSLDWVVGGNPTVRMRTDYSILPEFRQRQRHRTRPNLALPLRTSIAVVQSVLRRYAECYGMCQVWAVLLLPDGFAPTELPKPKKHRRCPEDWCARDWFPVDWYREAWLSEHPVPSGLSRELYSQGINLCDSAKTSDEAMAIYRDWYTDHR